MKHLSALPAVCLLLAALLCLPAAAEGIETAPGSVYCFSQSDFVQSGAALDGIYLAKLPSASVGRILLGARTLRTGDVVPASLIPELRLIPASASAQEAEMVFCPVAGGHVESAEQMKIFVRKKTNEPPVAKDSSMETYKNIPNTGTLDASDPEGGPIAFTLVTMPRRGTVELGENGSFTYTPDKNKVGRDSFTYYVTDEAGNLSGEATVSVLIRKPSDKAAFADMVGDPDQFVSLWMKEQGLFGGEEIADTLCFCPEKSVSRGEFLVMAMKLLGAPEAEASLVSGFADEAVTPEWMRSYIVTALRSGMVSGAVSDAGMVFRPTAAVTRAEAAVMLQNALRLPDDGAEAVFAAGNDVPAWAAGSVSALGSAGISLTGSAEPVSRREAARLLYQISALLDSMPDLRLPWN